MDVGGSANGTVGLGEWAFYHVSLLRDGQEANFTVHETNTGAVHDCDLYLQVQTFPTRRSYFARDTGLRRDSLVTINSTAPRGVWYAGVYGFLGCSFTLSVSGPSVDCPGGCSSHGTCGPDGVCACSAGYGGADCALTNRSLTLNQPLSDAVVRGAWAYFYYDITEAKEKLVVSMDAEHDADLYVRREQLPTQWANDAFNVSSPAAGQRDLASVTLQSPTPGRLYVGVFGFEASTFTIKVSETSIANSVCVNNCSHHEVACAAGVCTCKPGFSGDACEVMVAPLAFGGAPVAGFVDAGQWNYYTAVTDSDSVLVATVHQTSTGGDCDVYARFGTRPNRTDYDVANLGSQVDSVLNVTDPGVGSWTLGVFGWKACAYEISLAQVAVANDCAHGHANPTRDGCICDAGYYGELCNAQAVPLTPNGAALQGSVAPAQWTYYVLTATSVSFVVTVQERNSATGGGVQLFLQDDVIPTDRDFAASDTTRALVHYAHVESTIARPRTVLVGIMGSQAGDGRNTSFTVAAFAFPSSS